MITKSYSGYLVIIQRNSYGGYLMIIKQLWWVFDDN